jgi:hypothetical protein
MSARPHRPLCASLRPTMCKPLQAPLTFFMAEIALVKGVQQASCHDGLSPGARQAIQQMRLNSG